VGERFSPLVQTGSGVHPASYTMGTGSFPGVKRLERGVKHPQISSAEVRERIELHFYSPSVFMAGDKVNFTFTFNAYLETALHFSG
jgi:hypothetical protein